MVVFDVKLHLREIDEVDDIFQRLSWVREEEINKYSVS